MPFGSFKKFIPFLAPVARELVISKVTRDPSKLIEAQAKRQEELAKQESKMWLELSEYLGACKSAQATTHTVDATPAQTEVVRVDEEVDTTTNAGELEAIQDVKARVVEMQRIYKKYKDKDCPLCGGLFRYTATLPPAEQLEALEEFEKLLRLWTLNADDDEMHQYISSSKHLEKIREEMAQ